jgi:hypothetical protein
MKKFLVIAAILAVCGVTANAAMQALDFAVAVSGTSTNSRAYTVRGTVEGVYVTVPTGATGTVTVATTEQTLFTKSCTASAFYPVQVPVYTTAGAAATFNTYSATNTAGGATAAEAQAWYTKPAMAGVVTTTIVAAGGGTNWNVRLLYNP